MFVAQQPEAEFLTKELLQQLGGAFWIGLDRIRNQRDQNLDILSVVANVYDSSEPPVLKAGPLTLAVQACGTQPPLQQAGYLLQTGPNLTLAVADTYRVVYAIRLRTGEVKTFQQSFVLRDDPYGAVKQLLCCTEPVPSSYTPWPQFYRTPENNRLLEFSGMVSGLSWKYTTAHDADEYFIGEAILADDGSAYIRSGSFDSNSLWLNKFNTDGTLLWSVDISTLVGGSVRINPRGGVALDDSGNLYVTYESAIINSYSTDDGSLRWSYDVSGDGDMGVLPVQTTPKVDQDGKIHFATSSISLTKEQWAYSLNPDGSVNWKTKIWTYTSLDGQGLISAAISGDHVYYVTGTTRLQSVGRTTGSVEWTTQIAELGGSYTTAQVGAVVANNSLYELWPINKISPSENSERTAWGTIADLSVGTDSMVNGLGGYGAFYSLPAVDADGNVYTASKYTIPAFSNEGRITKYDSTGAELWHFSATVEGESFFAPVLASDCLIACAGGDNAFPVVSLGHVYFLNPADGSLLNTLSYPAAGSETTHGIGPSGVSSNGKTLYVAMGRTLYAYAASP